MIPLYCLSSGRPHPSVGARHAVPLPSACVQLGMMPRRSLTLCMQIVLREQVGLIWFLLPLLFPCLFGVGFATGLLGLDTLQ